MQNPKKSFYTKYRSLIYLITVPLVLSIIPIIFQNKASCCAFTILLITTYWLTDCVHIAITALIPNILFPLFGILPSRAVSRVYFEDFVMLFFGSILMANVLELTRIHERLALKFLIKFGSKPKSLLLGVMMITSFISLWITNAAAVSLILPILCSILQQYFNHTEKLNNKKSETNMAFDDTESSGQINDIKNQNLSLKNNLFDETVIIDEDHRYRLTTGFFLACTYSSTIGSIGSLMKTPSNIMLKGYINKYHLNSDLNFLNFTLFTIPLSIILVGVTWCFLSWYWIPKGLKINPSHDSKLVLILKEKYQSLGPMIWEQKCVLFLFGFLVLSWALTDMGVMKINKNISDTTPSVLTAILVFLCPKENIFAGKPYKNLIEWNQLQQIFPWHTILLIGPVIAISDAIEASGLGLILTSTFQKIIETFMFNKKEIALFLIIFFSSLTTEFTANNIIVSIFFVIADTIAKDLKVNCLYLLIPMSISSCLGFMLPLASLNNFMAFGIGSLKMGDMIKCGVYVNMISALITFIYTNSIFGIFYEMSNFD